MTDRDVDYSAEDAEFKSKTQLKSESLALQKLGKELVDLGAAALSKIPMDEELEEAVMLARRINRKKEGFKRQLQFIGKLMRSRDVSPIEEALLALKTAHQQNTQAFHALERHRDAIVQHGDDAINALLSEHPHLDRQKLRQLARQATKEQQLDKPPKASREIFQYLKSSIED